VEINQCVTRPSWLGTGIATPSSGEEPASVERYAPRTGAGRVSNAVPVAADAGIHPIDGRSVCTGRAVRTYEWASVERRGTGIAVDATPERAVNC
jgi:hypothetical protein